MVVLTATDYNEFKALALDLGTGATVKVYARDGVTTGVGFHVVTFATDGQLTIRYMQPTKPATFEADFPKRKYVRDFQLV